VDNRFTRAVRPRVDRALMRHRFGVMAFQALANRLSPGGRAALFGQSGASAAPTARFGAPRWQVEDGPAHYELPLRPDHAAFDWAAALGALGHDAGVKAIYRRLAEAAAREDARVRFIDVGANFGWHSFWHLAAGHDVIAFEPNPNCHDYFRRVCALNGWPAEVLRPMAVGAAQGTVELHFPPGREWLGTVQPAKVRHADPSSWSHQPVPIVSLDALALADTAAWIVLKIDTEGNELDVLRGASGLLAKCRAVLFESWVSDPDRAAIFDRLADAGFEVMAIDEEGCSDVPLGRDAFVADRETNFCGSRKTGKTSDAR
jgi:FkbM family methyltransferase